MSYSAVKKADTSTILLRTSLTDLQNLNQAAEQGKPKSASGKEEDDLFDSECDRFLDANSVAMTEIVKGTAKMESHSELLASDQENDVQSQPVDDDCKFDSEFERIFENSNLEKHLSRVFANKRSSQLSNGTNATQETKDDEVDKELNRLNARDGDDAELFDSDAVNDEDGDDEQSNDGFRDHTNNDEPNRFAGGHDENSGENEKDLDRLASEELEEEELFSADLDTTLIKGDDPAENEFFTQAVTHFDPDDGDFKTAAGNPINVKMSEEAQKARAISLGIHSDYDPRTQAFK